MSYNKSKLIAIIGCTGKVGKFLVQKALRNGFKVKILTRRSPDKLPDFGDDVEIVNGDAFNFSDIRVLLKGCDVVINTIGQSPNAKQPIYSSTTNSILKVMEEYGIKRYIVVTGASLNTPGDKKDIFNKIVAQIMKWVFPTMISDKEKELDLLTKSNVDWTLVRLPMISEGSPKGTIKYSLECVPGTKIDNLDIADFLVKQITDESYFKKCPFIAG